MVYTAYEERDEAYRKALTIDPLNFHVHLGLARSFLAQKRWEDATRLRQHRKWVKDCMAKGVKIVAKLLPWLPLKLLYRIIFIERDLVK